MTRIGCNTAQRIAEDYRRFLEGDLVLGQIRRGSLRVCATEIGFYDFAAHLH
jgi:hypothetical protein